MESVWLKTSEKPRFDALNRNKNVDVLIIGGGVGAGASGRQALPPKRKAPLPGTCFPG